MEQQSSVSDSENEFEQVKKSLESSPKFAIDSSSRSAFSYQNSLGRKFMEPEEKDSEAKQN